MDGPLTYSSTACHMHVHIHTYIYSTRLLLRTLSGDPISPPIWSICPTPCKRDISLDCTERQLLLYHGLYDFYFAHFWAFTSPHVTYFNDFPEKTSQNYIPLSSKHSSLACAKTMHECLIAIDSQESSWPHKINKWQYGALITLLGSAWLLSGTTKAVLSIYVGPRESVTISWMKYHSPLLPLLPLPPPPFPYHGTNLSLRI